MSTGEWPSEYELLVCSSCGAVARQVHRRPNLLICGHRANTVALRVVPAPKRAAESGVGEAAGEADHRA